MKLYYIAGISHTDTPLFSSKVEQEEFFNRYVEASLDVFYPPYFTNKIEIPNSDVNYDDLLNYNINYLSIDFKDKTYYYFIRNVTYISEDVYQLDIEMDTIQTFMFDVSYHNARINRMSIPRWKNSLINRDYIRENYGNDSFRNYDYTNVNYDNPYSKGFFVAKFPSGTDYSYQDKLSRLSYDSTRSFQPVSIQEGTLIILIPCGIINSDIIKNYTRVNINEPDIRIDIISNATGDVLGSIQLTDLYLKLRAYSEKPDLIDMYYIPYSNIKNLTFTSRIDVVEKPDISGELIDVNEYVIEYHIDTVTPDNKLSIIDDVCIKIDRSSVEFKIHNIETDIIANTNKLQPFNYKYIPQLLDENYMQIEFGEKINRTTYPLSICQQTSLLGAYSVDIPSGFRSYRLTSTQQYITDTYDTTLVVNTKEQATIYNDAWKTFASQNQSSLTLGRFLSVVNIANNAISSKKPITSIASGAINFAQQEVNYANYKHTPDTLTQGNTFSSDVINSSLNVVSIIKEVTNIQDVATIYETIGYKVDKYVAGSPLSLNSRYYYNYYECSDMDIEPSVFITIDVENDIKERWKNGLRFWTYHSDTQNFMGSIAMGNVCEYDNVEIDLIEE